MGRPVLSDARYDFRGGRNTSVTDNQLNPNELMDCTNARVDSVYGGFTKRNGSRRMNTTALGSSIRAITTWDSPSGKQIAAIAFNSGTGNFRLYTKPFDFGTDFTDQGSIEFGVAATSVSGTQVHLPTFSTFRAATSGAPLLLYMAWLGWYNSWDGTNLVRLTGTTDAPPADLIQPYHTRMFARNANYPKHLFWSRIGDAAYWTTGTKTDGGSAMLDTLTGEEITAFAVVGGSLVIATPTSLVRFSGISSDDIVIQQDTEGISAEVGVWGTHCMIPVESLIALINERGLYAASESGIVALSDKIRPDWDNVGKTNMSTKFHLAHDQAGKQILCVVPLNGSEAYPKTIFSYSTRLQCWQGPYTYPFEIDSITTCPSTSLASQSSLGPFVLVGCTDGFVRLLDTGTKDDVLASGSGGSNIPMQVIMSVLKEGEATLRGVKYLLLEASLPLGSNLVISTSTDEEAYKDNSVASFGASTMHNYKVDLLEDSGHKILLKFTESSDQPVRIDGFTLYGWDMQRP